MKRNNNKRRLKYGTVSLLLCILAVTCVILLNVIAAVLCMRYEFMYIELNRPPVYDIGDECIDYIERVVIPEVKDNGEKIKIIFCDTRESLRSEDIYKYVFDSFIDVSERFDEYIEIDYLNIFDNPSEAKKYGVSSVKDVVCVYKDKHETLNLADFYSYKTVDYQDVVTAYNGERLIASCLMRVTQESSPMCYLTVNHGEAYGDYELVKVLAEAGYTVGTLDLYSAEIPEDCEILITFDPKKDLTVSGETSSISEVDKLDRFMSGGGKYMVFLSADTFASGGFENMESFLSSWGINYMHKTTESGIEACYLVKDSANSLSVDGYKVLASRAELGIGADIIGQSGAPNSFANTTYMSVSDGFVPDGKGNYVSAESGRVLSPLFLAHSSAVAWADGRAVTRASEEDFILMSISEQDVGEGKKSYLLASASVDFASGDAMQSASLGNSRTVSEIIRYMGKEDAPSSLVSKPIGESEIKSLTARDANIITVALVVLPLIVMFSVGTAVLIRRRNR